MSNATESNRPDRAETQQANVDETRQGAGEAPAPEQPVEQHDARPDFAEKDGAEKPETQSPARENLERVGVDAEHKTEAMRKHQRGTFP